MVGLLVDLARIDKFTVALLPGDEAVENTTATFLRGSAHCRVQLLQVVLELWRSVTGESGDADARVDGVDNDALAREGKLFTKVLHSHHLDDFRKWVAMPKVSVFTCDRIGNQSIGVPRPRADGLLIVNCGQDVGVLDLFVVLAGEES